MRVGPSSVSLGSKVTISANSRILSLFSLTSSHNEFERAVRDQDKSQWKQTVKMLLVMLVPNVTVIALAAVSLQNSLTVSQTTSSTVGAVNQAVQIGTLVGRILVERGTSTILLSAPSSATAITNLANARARV